MSHARLYVVATPIGNLEDISRRALDVLSSVDLVAAEDTRHSGALLRHHGIERSLVSLHEHNEEREAARLVERLVDGASIGRHCVIGAGAVVTAPVPPDSLAVGVPARVVKSI